MFRKKNGTLLESQLVTFDLCTLPDLLGFLSSRQSEYQIYGFMKHLRILLGKQTFSLLQFTAVWYFYLAIMGNLRLLKRTAIELGAKFYVSIAVYSEI